ncbi:MAG: hypothetical protein D6798_10250 [Deltaproteobacteria bacterium]|nr:MAG: hypothetical protein D6798_10250 [Deltaproteobacteria bacterium]
MTTLDAHALTLVLPLTPSRPDRPWAPWTGDPSAATAMYLTATARERLYRRRSVLSADPAPIVTPRGRRWRIERAELVTFDHCEVLALVLDGGSSLTVRDLLVDADVLRLLRPWWPGQALPHWVPEGPGLQPWVDAHVPDARPILDDPRALCWVLAAVDEPRHPQDWATMERTRQELVYALAHQDPPDMPPPPDPVRDAFFSRQGYRRWEAAGTFHAFTHYGGATVHFSLNSPPPRWLRATHTGLYVDLAIWVAAVTAARVQACEDHGLANLPHILHHHERAWERVRISEQDQGRGLVAAWLDAIEADHGHLAFLRRWVADWA